MSSKDMDFPVGALGVAWFGRKYSQIKIIKDNRKELHPVPVYEADSDEEDEVDYQDTDEDPASDEELFLYAQQGYNQQSDVTSIATEKATAAHKQLCYYVQTLDTRELYRWVPATAVRAAEGSQPFKPGFKDTPNLLSYCTKPPQGHLQQNTLELDALLPFKLTARCTSAPTTPLSKRKREEPPHSWLFENSKKTMYDNYIKALNKDYRLLNSRETLDGLLYDSREKHELVVVDVMSEREVKDYFDLWKRQRSSKYKTSDGIETSCCVCAKSVGRLRVCPRCPAVYHLPCRKQWLIQIIHDSTIAFHEQPAAGAPNVAPAPPDELRDVLPCPACVWEHRPSEKRWYMRLWPTALTERQLDAPLDKRPRL